MNNVTLSVFGAVFIGVAGMGHATTVDFAQYAEGDILGMTTNLGGGVVADVSQTGGTAPVIFDTAPGSVSTGNDGDLTSNFSDAEGVLAARDFGNVLIVQEDQSTQANPTTGPDDAGAGGSLTFDFMSLVELNSVYLLDSQIGTTAELFFHGASVSFFSLDASNESDTGDNPLNNQFTFLDFGGAVGDSFTVTFAGSGALGEFDATAVAAVPLPASLPLSVGGLGLMAFVRRRRKAS